MLRRGEKFKHAVRTETKRTVKRRLIWRPHISLLKYTRNSSCRRRSHKQTYRRTTSNFFSRTVGKNSRTVRNTIRAWERALNGRRVKELNVPKNDVLCANHITYSCPLVAKVHGLFDFDWFSLICIANYDCVKGFPLFFTFIIQTIRDVSHTEMIKCHTVTLFSSPVNSFFNSHWFRMDAIQFVNNCNFPT